MQLFSKYISAQENQSDTLLLVFGHIVLLNKLSNFYQQF
jgi:hypothetical protein